MAAKKSPAKSKPRPSRAKPKQASASRAPVKPKRKAKPRKKLDTLRALGILRDGLTPGTPFGFVTAGESQLNEIGVPYINKAEAEQLKRDGLVTIEDSGIRLV